ncbi:MAG: hypothetical protein LN412_06135 [Candidatus Thermoplasmatota archaeon]|nr:hypothetical protein [Candidatus Thermoplasmatota archaeon]
MESESPDNLSGWRQRVYLANLHTACKQKYGQGLKPMSYVIINARDGDIWCVGAVLALIHEEQAYWALPIRFSVPYDIAFGSNVDLILRMGSYVDTLFLVGTFPGEEVRLRESLTYRDVA